MDAVDEELSKIFTVEVAGSSVGGSTTQKDDDVIWQTPDNAIAPPLPLEALAKLSQVSPTRRALIEAIAINTVGLGMTVEAGPTADPKDNGDDVQKNALVAQHLNALARRDSRALNPTFTEQLMMVKTDEEEVGIGALEVGRNRVTGKIDGLFHVPGKRLRRRRDRSGWILLGLNGDTQTATEFYNFGEKVIYDGLDTATPTPTSTLAPGKAWETNELLVFRLYTSVSRDYGLPRDFGMAYEYAGDKLAAESNVTFFDSSGTPPTVLFVSGEESRDGQGRVTVKVPPRTVSKITETLRADTGRKHRVAVIPLPAGAKVQREELGGQAEQDPGNTKFRLGIQNRQLASFRMQGVFIGVEGGSRSAPEVQRSITLEQVFDPEQRRYEERLHDTLLTDLGYSDRKVTFKRLAVEGDAARRDSADNMATTQDITNREHRAAHGYPPLPEVTVGDELPDGRKVVETVAPALPPAPTPAPELPPAGPPVDPAADPANPPEPAPAPVAPPADPPEPPAAPTEVALAKVTMEEAALIGKVPAGWNDRLVSPPKGQAPFGGATGGDGRARPDQRGLQPGLAGRSRIVTDDGSSDPTGGSEPVAKGHEVDYVEAAASGLSTDYLDVTDEAITAGLKRTRGLAMLIAGELETAASQ